MIGSFTICILIMPFVCYQIYVRKEGPSDRRYLPHIYLVDTVIVILFIATGAVALFPSVQMGLGITVELNELEP